MHFCLKFCVASLCLVLLTLPVAAKPAAKQKAKTNSSESTPSTADWRPSIGPITDPNDPSVVERRASERYGPIEVAPAPIVFPPSSGHPQGELVPIKCAPAQINDSARLERAFNVALNGSLEHDRTLIKLANLPASDSALAEVLFDMLSAEPGRQRVLQFRPKIQKSMNMKSEQWKVLAALLETVHDKDGAAACRMF